MCNILQSSSDDVQRRRIKNGLCGRFDGVEQSDGEASQLGRGKERSQKGVGKRIDEDDLPVCLHWR